MQKANPSLQHFDSIGARYSGYLLHAFFRYREAAHVRTWLKRQSSLGSVLDVCCGAGFYSKLALEMRADISALTALDQSAAMTQAARELLELKYKDKIQVVTTLAEHYSTEALHNTILLLGGLEFADDSERFLKNITAQLTQKATALVLVPRCDLPGRLYRAYHRRHGIEIKLFRLDQVQELFNAYGFTCLCVKSVAPFNWLVSYERQ